MTIVTFEAGGVVYPVSRISAKDMDGIIELAQERFGEVVGYPAFYCIDGGFRLYPHPVAGVTVRITAE